jgi:hypothetical protein
LTIPFPLLQHTSSESGYVYGVETFLEDYELVEEVCCSKGKGIVKSYYPKYIKFVFIYNEENI